MQAEIVNGRCPTCHEMTILVGLSPEFFRCINCGSDLQQHINGKISYIPAMCLSDKEKQELVLEDNQNDLKLYNYFK